MAIGADVGKLWETIHDVDERQTLHDAMMDRDRLWCRALIDSQITLVAMEAVLTTFNQLREDEGHD